MTTWLVAFEANRNVVKSGKEIDATLISKSNTNGIEGHSEINSLEKEKTKKSGSKHIELGKKDLDELRIKLGVLETNTIAIGKTNVKGLENCIFEGGSPAVRREAGLPDIDIVYPYRIIKSSGKIPSATRHAEEVVANEFVKAVEELGLELEDVVGTLRIHQSNPKGVCPTCLSGLGNPMKYSGVIKQLSLKYPNLEIDVTSETVEGIKPNGRLNFKVKNGQYIE